MRTRQNTVFLEVRLTSRLEGEEISQRLCAFLNGMRLRHIGVQPNRHLVRSYFESVEKVREFDTALRTLRAWSGT